MGTSDSDIETIWNEYRQRLKAFLHSKVSDPGDVDDLLQEVLIKTYQKLDSLRSSDRLKSWLFQIANNAIIDHYRRQARATELTTALSMEESAGEDSHALEACIVPFLDALPETQRYILKSTEFENRPQKELAEETGLPYSTFKSRVQKARSDLRKLFEDCCHFSVDGQGNIIDYRSKSDYCKNC